MEGLSHYQSIRRLLYAVPRGTPLDAATLAAHAINTKTASAYAKTGWLIRVGHGVYALPGDSVTEPDAVLLLQRRIEGLHVGGRSALALHGVRQNLSPRETLVLWADRRFTLPRWFSEQFPSRAVSAALFSSLDARVDRATVAAPPGVTSGLRSSGRERAALELLYDVGTHESLDEAHHLFEGLHDLCVDTVGALLSACTSVKAVRLFLTWSREFNLLDVDSLRERFPLKVGSASRWVSRMPDGTLLQLKPYG